MPPLSQSLRGTPYLLLNGPHCILTRNPNTTLQLGIHTSSKKRDIPEYLQGNISEVASLEDDLLLNDLEEEEGNDMEEDIVDFLTSHLIAYEETATSFTVQCPACSKEDNSARPQEVFVDKNSGQCNVRMKEMKEKVKDEGRQWKVLTLRLLYYLNFLYYYYYKFIQFIRLKKKNARI